MMLNLMTFGAVPPAAVRIMPLGDSLTEFSCFSNSYYNAEYQPIFQPLNETPATAIYPKGTYFIGAQGGYRGHLASMLGDPRQLPSDVQSPPVNERR